MSFESPGIGKENWKAVVVVRVADMGCSLQALISSVLHEV
jgi:hypothetical protein